MPIPRPPVVPHIAVDAARNFRWCIGWVNSHWLTAIERERERLRAVTAGDLADIRYYAEKCESYEKQRNREWQNVRQSAFVIIAAAEDWGIDAKPVIELFGRYDPQVLPVICGRGRNALKEPDFGPALEVGRQVEAEGEIRAALEGQSTVTEYEAASPESIALDSDSTDPAPFHEGFAKLAEQLERAGKTVDERFAGTLPSNPGMVEPTHSDDFTTVNWFGTEYTFDDGLQAKAVALLWAAYEKGGHGLSEKTIGERIGSSANAYRLANTFREHPAWEAMIVKVQQGIYRLEKPK